MNPLRITCVLFLITQVVFLSCGGADANVKITPIAVENKSSMKSDLKSEEARYRDPIMPEYYDRNNIYGNRQNFVTGGAYGNPMSNYDRYGYNNNNYDRYGGYGGSSSPNTYGSWKDKTLGQLENKLNYMTGGLYNSGGYGNRYPYENGNNLGPYPPPPMPHHGLLPPELEAKTGLLLPLAGAALLGIAAYALVTNPAIAMAAGPVAYGKRRKRSLFDEKIEQNLVYRAHHQRK